MLLLGGAELSDLATAYHVNPVKFSYLRMDLFGSDLRRRVCVKVMPAPQAARSTHIRWGAFKALPALWWMAHRVVEAGQGFDLVRQFTEGIYCCCVGC